MSLYYIPGPNNELTQQAPPDTSSRFPREADYAESASWAATASYFVGFIESASYAKYAETSSFNLGFTLSASYAAFAATASYLLGSVQSAISASWAQMSGHSLTSTSASHADLSDTASYAKTASLAVTSSYSLLSLTASYAITASYVNTASYSNQSTTASYALTASYFGGLAPSSSYARTASYATYAETASYVQLNGITIQGSGSAFGYIDTMMTASISSATVIDSFSTSRGNSAKWMLSIGNGTAFKTSEVTCIWDPVSNTTNFTETTTNSIGSVTVSMSVSLSGGLVRLIANPSSGTWTIKMMRFLL